MYSTELYLAIKNSSKNKPILQEFITFNGPELLDVSDLINALNCQNDYSVRVLMEAGCEVNSVAFHLAMQIGSLKTIKLFYDMGYDVSVAATNFIFFAKSDIIRFVLQHYPNLYPFILKKVKVQEFRAPLASIMELAFFDPEVKFEERIDFKRIKEICERIATRILKRHLNCAFLHRKFMKEQLESYNSLFGDNVV